MILLWNTKHSWQPKLYDVFRTPHRSQREDPSALQTQKRITLYSAILNHIPWRGESIAISKRYFARGKRCNLNIFQQRLFRRLTHNKLSSGWQAYGPYRPHMFLQWEMIATIAKTSCFLDTLAQNKESLRHGLVGMISQALIWAKQTHTHTHSQFQLTIKWNVHQLSSLFVHMRGAAKCQEEQRSFLFSLLRSNTARLQLVLCSGFAGDMRFSKVMQSVTSDQTKNQVDIENPNPIVEDVLQANYQGIFL